MAGSADSTNGLGILLSNDLIFASRITGTAQLLGFEMKPAQSMEEVERLARNASPRCVILDLANPGLDVTELLRQLREVCSAMPCVVAYGSHVDAAGLHSARQAGCDVVWPRSKFVQELSTALPAWMAWKQ
jgi:CheY-like chemotaxis protein